MTIYEEVWTVGDTVLHKQVKGITGVILEFTPTDGFSTDYENPFARVEWTYDDPYTASKLKPYRTSEKVRNFIKKEVYLEYDPKQQVDRDDDV